MMVGNEHSASEKRKYFHAYTAQSIVSEGFASFRWNRRLEKKYRFYNAEVVNVKRIVFFYCLGQSAK